MNIEQFELYNTRMLEYKILSISINTGGFADTGPSVERVRASGLLNMDVDAGVGANIFNAMEEEV